MAPLERKFYKLLNVVKNKKILNLLERFFFKFVKDNTKIKFLLDIQNYFFYYELRRITNFTYNLNFDF